MRSFSAVVLALTIGGCIDTSLVLDELPKEVLFVSTQREAFDTSASSMRSVTPGTVIDPPSALAGCWGSVEVDDELGTATTTAEFYRFDLDSGKIEHQRYVGVNGESPQPWGAPVVWVFGETLLSADNGTLSRRIDSTEYAAIAADGALVPNAAADFGAFLDDGVEFYRFYSIDGNELLITDKGFDDDAPKPDDANVDVFVRFNCPD